MRCWAAAWMCGLLLLSFPLETWAAPKKSVRKALKNPAKAQPLSDIGQAEMIDKAWLGLRGHASFYGTGFQGRKTATGELFDVRNFTGASNRFPLGSLVAVRRMDNERCAIVKINDRMHAKQRRRIIDVSRSVAEYLGMVQAGVVLVRVAPLKDKQRDHAAEDCRAAFEPDVTCDDCGQPAFDP